MRLIDADKLIFDGLTDSICQGQAEEVVAEAPTIYPPMGYKVLADGRGWAYYGKEEAEPVRRGRWYLSDHAEYYQCSVCDSYTHEDDKWNYCPNCGSRMEGQE